MFSTNNIVDLQRVQNKESKCGKTYTYIKTFETLLYLYNPSSFELHLLSPRKVCAHMTHTCIPPLKPLSLQTLTSLLTKSNELPPILSKFYHIQQYDLQQICDIPSDPMSRPSYLPHITWWYIIKKWHSLFWNKILQYFIHSIDHVSYKVRCSLRGNVHILTKPNGVHIIVKSILCIAN